jgi:hypothetical protein
MYAAFAVLSLRSCSEPSLTGVAMMTAFAVLESKR